MIGNRNIILVVISIYNAVVVTAYLNAKLINRNDYRSSSTFLNLKNSHRARFEKNLEDMMGNDWRMFRAKLVAQEADEHEQMITASVASSSTSMRAFGEPEDALYEDRQVKQEKFGKIFAAIFSSNNKGVEMEREDDVSKGSIFDGQHVGGATPDSMIPETCEDPFVSEAELPVLLKSRVHIDKHRWAHPLSHIEPGCVLIANEKLGGVFHQTVVLIVEHNEGAGSTGIVINR